MKRKEKIVDELNLVQMQIQRMANNSFIIKGWYITFFVAFIFFVLGKDKYEFIPLGIGSALFIAFYDCYFLMLERKYRGKYNWVIKNTNKEEELFDLNPYNINTFIPENENCIVKKAKKKIELENENNCIKKYMKNQFIVLIEFGVTLSSKPILFFYGAPILYLIVLA